ncbi:hypothetical protein [Intrasporangium sp.]|nr:hypothetical protein [Intrasporangium sp.]
MKVIATAVRSGEWWAVEIVSERGTLHTQTRRLAQVGGVAGR